MHPSQQSTGRSRRIGRRRTGSITLQMIIILPILIITFIAIIQLGFLITLKQAVSHAATVAAREAGKSADIDHVVCVVNAILKVHCLSVGDAVSVTLEDPDATPDTVTAGGPACPPPATPVLDPSEVRVTVCVDMSHLTVGNALAPIGICVGGKTLQVSSVVKKEIYP